MRQRRWGDRRQGLASLQRYPLPLPTPKAALDLEGIGTYLVERFEKYLANFLKEHGPSWADAEAAAGSTPPPLPLGPHCHMPALTWGMSPSTRG